jgi:hypothetical protein
MAGFWKKHVCPDLCIYKRLVHVGFKREKEERRATRRS